MHFTVSAATLLAFAGFALSQTDGFDAIDKPTKNEVVQAGSTYSVVWEYQQKYNGAITITLLQGKTPETLSLGNDVATSIDNSAGSFAWAVDSSLGADDTYGLKITWDSDKSIFQYSNPFKIQATTGSSSSSSTSGWASSSSSSSGSWSSSTSAVSNSTSTESVMSTKISSSLPTASASGNLSTTASVARTTMTSSLTASRTASATGSTSSVPTSSAGRVVAGTFAVVYGIAAVLYAL